MRAEDIAARVLAVDPGKTTGYATLNWPLPGFASHQLPWLEFLTRTHFELQREYNVASPLPPIQVVVEEFVITPNTHKLSAQPEVRDVRGAMRYLSLVYLGQEPTFQTAANAKSFASDSLLKQLGWWSRGKPHANDAARHLVVRLVDIKALAARDLL